MDLSTKRASTSYKWCEITHISRVSSPHLPLYLRPFTCANSISITMCLGTNAWMVIAINVLLPTKLVKSLVLWKLSGADGNIGRIPHLLGGHHPQKNTTKNGVLTYFFWLPCPKNHQRDPPMEGWMNLYRRVLNLATGLRGFRSRRAG